MINSKKSDSIFNLNIGNNDINKYPSFMKESLRFRETLANYCLLNAHNKVTSITSSVPLKENFVCLNDGQILLLPDNVWDQVYNMLVETPNIFASTDLSAIENAEKMQDFLLKKNPIMGFPLIKEIESILHQLNGPVYDKRNKYQFIWQQLDLNIPVTAKIIGMALKNKIVHNLIRTKDSSSELQYTETYTTCSYNLGKSIFDTFLCHKLGPLSNVILTYHFYNERASFSDLEIYKNCIIDICNNNMLPLDRLYGLKAADKNDMLFKIINGYMLLFALERKEEKSEEFFMISDILKLNFSEQMINIKILELRQELKSFLVQLGSLVVQQMLDRGILTQNVTFVNNKTIYIVSLAEEACFSLVANASMQRPPLLQSQRLSAGKEIYKNNLYTVFIKNASPLMHFKAGQAKSTLKTNSFIYKEKDNLFLQLTIDTEFLDSFLSYGLKFFNKNFSDFKENTSEVFSFLNLYGIDFEHMLLIGSGDTRIIEDLITFALNFEEYRDPLLKKAIFAIPNKIKKEQLRRLYLKIQAYKLFLRTFFSECIIYSLFGFFISGCFLDFRGRLYYQGYYLNLQNYKITKAFIKLYGSNTQSTLEKNFQLIKDTILGTFNNPPDNQLASVNEYMYKKANASFFEDFLFSYIDSKKITKNAFILLINTQNTFASLHLQISNIIKKKARSFVVLSYILSPHSIFFTNICSLDAVSSGSQMTSILLRSKTLGKLSNLFGDLDFEVYTELNLAFHKKKDLLVNAYTLQYPLLKEELINFFACPKRSDIVKLIESFRKKKLHGFSKDDEWILDLQDSSDFSAIKTPTNIEIVRTIYIYKNINKYIASLNCNPWIKENKLLFHRELFKQAMMTFGYGATSFGRQNDFLKFFENHAVSLGILIIDKKALTTIIMILDRFFLHFISTQMPEATCLRKIAQDISNLNKPMQIENQTFIINISPYKTETHRVVLPKISGLAVHSLTLQCETTDLDLNKLKLSFCPSWIHSMDAMVVHEFIKRMFIIRKLLSEKNIHVCFFTNHDSFFFNFPYFLPFILRDIYIDLYNYNYIKTIRKNFTEGQYKKLESFVNNPGSDNYLSNKFTNPYFFKF